MVCTYLDISFRYNRLVHTLRIEAGFGTPFHNIRNLESSSIHVLHQKRGTLKILFDLLDSGWPIIVSVQTDQLPHWDGMNTQHAVVVVGMSSELIYLNDPEYPDAVMQTPIGDFDLAWLEQDEEYAVLSPV